MTEKPSTEAGPRSLSDIAIAALAAALTIALFAIDCTQPRGVVDGVGYPAVVALAARFGRGPLMGTTLLCTLLIVGAHFLAPDSGIAIGAELANRAFGLASIWIVADVMQRRIAAAHLDQNRTTILARNQAALARIVREALVADKLFADRIKCVTEIAGETIGADLTGVFRFYENGLLLRSIDTYQASSGDHFVMMDIRTPDTPGYDRLIREDYTIVIEDVEKTQLFGARDLTLKTLNIRAMITIGVLLGSELAGQLVFARLAKPHKWTDQDIAFARAVGNLVTSLFSLEVYRGTLEALNMVGEGIVAEDGSGSPVYANSTAISMAAASEGSGLSLGMLKFPRPPLPLTTETDQTLIRHGDREMEIHRTRLPLGGMISRIDDVTVRNATLRQRDQLQARLQQSAKMEAVGQLAGGVAHDFNNILGAIMGFAGFLMQDLPEHSEQHRFAERILSATERGKELIEQILTFARTKGAGGDVADLNRALEQNTELVRGTFPSTIAVEIAAEADSVWVQCSASRLSQLLLNLCINARDAIGPAPGKITLHVARTESAELQSLIANETPNEITVGNVQPNRSYARIRVSDTGGGIALDALKHIFEPFYTTKDRQRGTGLGLAVVHGVIDSADGFGHVRVTPGSGTQFTVYIPLAESASPVTEEPANGEARGNESVLVVDDEPDIVDMMVIGLERLGYRAVGVSHPVEALEAFQEEPDAFDVVVTDFLMPSLRGTDLIRKIKAIRPGIGTILCTAFSDGGGDEELKCADAVFKKPVDAASIAQSIRALKGERVTKA